MYETPGLGWSIKPKDTKVVASCFQNNPEDMLSMVGAVIPKYSQYMEVYLTVMSADPAVH